LTETETKMKSINSLTAATSLLTLELQAMTAEASLLAGSTFA